MLWHSNAKCCSPTVVCANIKSVPLYSTTCASHNSARLLVFTAVSALFMVRSDLISSGLGSPEIQPSVLEHGAMGAISLDQADDSFVLQPTPQGLKSYCIIQRTRSVLERAACFCFRLLFFYCFVLLFCALYDRTTYRNCRGYNTAVLRSTF